MITRTSQARWQGELKSGSGHIKLGSGAFEGAYSFATRFESAPGTNPEELIAAAHAGCFSMALNLALTTAGFPPEYIATSAAVSMDRVDGAMTIVGIKLTTRGKVPGITAEGFLEHAEGARKNCIVSRALAAVPITLDAALE